MQSFANPSSFDMALWLNGAQQVVAIYDIPTYLCIITSLMLAFMLKKYSLWAKIPAFLFGLQSCFALLVMGMYDKLFQDNYWMGVARAKHAGETLSASVQYGLTQSGITEQTIITPDLFANSGRMVISVLTIIIMTVVLFPNERSSSST